MPISSILHLAKRFFVALRPGEPRSEDLEWAYSLMTPGEQDLWRQMSGPDKRHSIQVARDVETALGRQVERSVLAAALLHDVGKIESNLGTWARAIATLVGLVLSKNRTRSWTDREGGILRQIGLYHDHPEGGAALLTFAGSDALTIAWAREHHLSPHRWSVDRATAMVLKQADND